MLNTAYKLPHASNSRYNQNASPDQNVKTKYNSKENINNLTKDFIIIPPDKFNLIIIGNFVRYKNINGDFCLSSFVTHITKGDNSLFIIKLTNGINEMCTYCVLWSKIQTLWKKIEIESHLMYNVMEQRHDMMNDISLFLYKKFRDDFKNFMDSQNGKCQFNQSGLTSI